MVIGHAVADRAKRSRLVLAADAVAHDPTTSPSLAAAATPQQELERLVDRVNQRARADSELVGMGVSDWLSGVRDRLGEVLGRAVELPAFAISIAAAELRPKLNDLVSVFLGDVFEYINNRGTPANPGDIPCRFLGKLREAHQAGHHRATVIGGFDVSESSVLRPGHGTSWE